MVENLSSASEKWKGVVLFGPPGSGKGTLGRVLCAAGNHVHIASGDIFRGLDPDSESGKIFHQYASQGHLVPDEVTIQISHHYIEGLVAANRFIPHKQLLLLDGIPRTLKQAQVLDRYVEIIQVIVLDIQSLKELTERLTKRSFIENRRDDQSLEVVKTRMQVYETETLNVLSHYSPNLISHFNASQRPIEVLRDVLNKLAPIL